MELVIALLGGAAGGSLICGISPKISVKLWVSLLGGMVGGATLHLLFAKFLLPGGTKVAATADLASLFSLLILGFAGGVLALALICIRRWRDIVSD